MAKLLSVMFIAVIAILINLTVVDGQQNTNVEPSSWSPSGTYIALGYTNGNIEIWEANTKKLVATLEGHTQEIMTLSWSPKGSQIASGSPDGTIKIWDTTTWKSILVIQFAQSNAPHRAINDLSWSPNSEFIAAALENGNVQIWNTETGNLVTTYSHDIMAVAVAWNPTQSILASAGLDGRILFWDAVNQKLSEFISLSPNRLVPLYSLAWNSTGDKIAIGSGRLGKDISVSVFNVTTRKLIFQLPITSNKLIRIQWSPTREELAVVDRDAISIIDPSTARIVDKLSGNTIMAGNSWSPNGGRFILRNTNQQDERNLDDVIQIVVPNASIDKLQSIAQICGVQANVRKLLIPRITTKDLEMFVTGISSLSNSQMQPSCKADLLAVASALMTKAQ